MMKKKAYAYANANADTNTKTSTNTNTYANTNVYTNTNTNTNTSTNINENTKSVKVIKKVSKKAIALKYDKEKGTAPIITAVGKGIVADKIIEAADKSGVARVEDEFQANALSAFDAGSKVPKFLYDLVAEVLLFVEEADIKNQNGGVVH